MTRRVLALPVGDERVASVRYRVLAYRPALERAGFACAVRYPVRLGDGVGRRAAARLIDLTRDAAWTRAELVFVHRKTYPPLFASRMRARGAPLVFDLDDALDLPPPGTELGPGDAQRWARNFRSTVDAADLVICGNRELVRRVGHGRCAVLATPIDTERFRPGAVPPATGPVLGWVGRSDNLGYLARLAEPLRKLAAKHTGFRLVVVADRSIDLPGVPVEFRRWALDDELTCFAGFAVGLMPLEDSPWSRAKCAFKAIQYMALGIPAVVSPVGMNTEVVQDGVNGLLAADDDGWYRALDALLTDRSLAARIGAEGRKTVERDYGLVGASRTLVGLFEEVLAGRSSRQTNGRSSSGGQRASSSRSRA